MAGEYCGLKTCHDRRDPPPLRQPPTAGPYQRLSPWPAFLTYLGPRRRGLALCWLQ